MFTVQPTMVGSAVETRVPTLDVVVVRAGCLNADHALAPAASEGHGVAGRADQTSRAAAFITDCSLSSGLPGKPASVPPLTIKLVQA